MGGAVILTLHNYYLARGDYFNYSNIYYFTQIFSKRTTLIIDEAHQYLTQFDKIVPITYGYMKTPEIDAVVPNSLYIRKLSDFDKYYITLAILELRKVEGTVNFTAPTRVSPHNLMFNLFKKSVVHTSRPGGHRRSQ